MRFEVSGRPSHEEAAAIAAVIDAVIEEESQALATPPQAPRQSSWVLAWRPRDVPAPLPSHTYDARPWSDVEPGARIETDE
jgi:hypothetical protein